MSIRRSPIRMFLLTAALVFVAALFGARLSNAAVASQKRSPRLPASRQKQPAVKKPRIDYARFSHTTHVVTQKLTCNLCHQVPSKNWKAVRQGEAIRAHNVGLTCGARGCGHCAIDARDQPDRRLQPPVRLEVEEAREHVPSTPSTNPEVDPWCPRPDPSCMCSVRTRLWSRRRGARP